MHDSGTVYASVKDTGIGIQPKDLYKVFDKFRQVGDTLTQKPRGTGLGLPICKQIIQYHRGQIWVESSPNQGSTFYFSLDALGEDEPINNDHQIASLSF